MTIEVRSDFRYRPEVVSRARSKRPTLRFLGLGKRVRYVQPRDFAGCPGYRP